MATTAAPGAPRASRHRQMRSCGGSVNAAPRQSRRCASSTSAAASLLLIVITIAAACISCTDAAQLPLHVRWLSAVVPPAVAPALRDFYVKLPEQLCGLGPEGIAELPTSVMDELCPLKAATRLGRLGLPGLRGAADSAAVARVAAMPVTVGGALNLLAARDVDDAAALQQRVCDTLLYPKLNCRFGGGKGGSGIRSAGGNSTSFSSGSGSSGSIGSRNGTAALDDSLGPLAQHLDAKENVGEWLAATVVPVAVAPLGATLSTLPDALCAVSPATLLSLPSKIREQLCPHNAALLPVMALLSMGRTASASLEAKLCDLLRRPGSACRGGTYKPDNTTAVKLAQIKRDTSNAVYSWEPRMPKLSVPLFDPTSANLGLGGDGALDRLAAWWKNETAPELRRFALAAFVPPALQPAVADLLEKLPDSVCSLPAATPLPLAFTYQACPAASVLDALKGARGRPQAPSWGLALAEVAMGAGGSEASAEARARVDAWVVRMCSAIYARDVACKNTTVAPTSAALDVVGERAKPLAAEIVSRALAAMPPGQRRWLVEGTTRQLQAWRQRVHHLPRGATRALLGPLCTAGDTRPWSILSKSWWSVSAAVTTAVDAAIVSAVQPTAVLASIVGEEEANLAAAEICGVAAGTDEAPASTNNNDQDGRNATAAPSKASAWPPLVGGWMKRPPAAN